MKPKKPNMRIIEVADIIDLSPHLRRIIFTGTDLQSFPVAREGAHIKVALPAHGDEKMMMRSYTIRFYHPETHKLAIDFVVNRHNGPATHWAKHANVGDIIRFAGPGQMKLTDFNHHSYLLVGDLTSVNAINGFVPRFDDAAKVCAIITVPTRADIIKMDYDDSTNTLWFIEDESAISLEDKVLQIATALPKDTHVFMGLEATSIRALRAILQDDIGFERVNTFAVGYWKKGVDADRFGEEKKLNPL